MKEEIFITGNRVLFARDALKFEVGSDFYRNTAMCTANYYFESAKKICESPSTSIYAFEISDDKGNGYGDIYTEIILEDELLYKHELCDKDEIREYFGLNTDIMMADTDAILIATVNEKYEDYFWIETTYYKYPDGLYVVEKPIVYDGVPILHIRQKQEINYAEIFEILCDCICNTDKTAYIYDPLLAHSVRENCFARDEIYRLECKYLDLYYSASENVGVDDYGYTTE